MVEIEGRRESVKVAAFDLEGTIVDLEKLHFESHLRAAAEQGIDLSLEQAIALSPHFIGGPDEQVALELTSLAPGRVDVNEFLRSKKAHFLELYLHEDLISPRKGLPAFLEWITNSGVIIAIGTVTARAFAEELLIRSGVADLLPTLRLVAREDIQSPKPSPDVYIKTAAICGVSPVQQIVFEDSPTGVKAGRLAGSHVLAIPTIQTEALRKKLISEGAQCVYSDWESPELRRHIVKAIGRTPAN